MAPEGSGLGDFTYQRRARALTQPFGLVTISHFTSFKRRIKDSEAARGSGSQSGPMVCQKVVERWLWWMGVGGSKLRCQSTGQCSPPDPAKGPSTIRALAASLPKFWPYCPYSCSFCPSQQASRSYKLFRPHTASISLCSITHLSRLVSHPLPLLHTHAAAAVCISSSHAATSLSSIACLTSRACRLPRIPQRLNKYTKSSQD